ncbi:MAG: hypothetical protein V9E94_07970 [Microthrixaceae bacterium]
MDEPADGLHAVGLHLCDHRLGEEASESGSLTVMADGDDHQVPMRCEHPSPFVLDSLVGGRCDDLATVLRNHDPTIEGVLSRVVAAKR